MPQSSSSSSDGMKNNHGTTNMSSPAWLGRQISAAYDEHAALIESLQKKLQESTNREKHLLQRLESQNKYNSITADSGIKTMYNANLIRPDDGANDEEDMPIDEIMATYGGSRRHHHPGGAAIVEDDDELPMDEMAHVARKVQTQREFIDKRVMQEKLKNMHTVQELQKVLEQKDAELQSIKNESEYYKSQAGCSTNIIRRANCQQQDTQVYTSNALIVQPPPPQQQQLSPFDIRRLAGMPCNINVLDYDTNGNPEQLPVTTNSDDGSIIHKIPSEDKDKNEKHTTNEDDETHSGSYISDGSNSQMYRDLVEKLAKSLDWMLLSTDTNLKNSNDPQRVKPKNLKLSMQEEVLMDKVQQYVKKTSLKLNLTNMLYKEKIQELQKKVKEQDGLLEKQENDQKVKKDRISQLENECRRLKASTKRRRNNHLASTTTTTTTNSTTDTSSSVTDSNTIQLLQQELASIQIRYQTQKDELDTKDKSFQQELQSHKEDYQKLQDEKVKMEEEHMSVLDAFRRVMNDTITNKDEEIEDLKDEIDALNLQLDGYQKDDDVNKSLNEDVDK